MRSAGLSQLVLISACVLVMARCEQPAGLSDAVKLGDYTVLRAVPAHCSIDKHGGGQLADRIFYKGHRVTDWAMWEFVSPYNSARLIFEVSPACGESESQTGTFYFDPFCKEPVKVAVVSTSGSQQETDAMWSRDDKFIALGKAPKIGLLESSELVLVNLATAKSIDLSRRLHIRGTIISHASFRGWSPDGKRLALVVSSSLSQPDRQITAESDLISFDPETMTPTYLATMRQDQGWVAGEFRWVKRAGETELAIEPSMQNSADVYVKLGGPAFDPVAQLPI